MKARQTGVNISIRAGEALTKYRFVDYAGTTWDVKVCGFAVDAAYFDGDIIGIRLLY